MKWFRVKESGKSATNQFGFKISTPWEYDPNRPHNQLSIKLFRWFWYINIPELIKPRFKWVDTSHYEWATPGPDGRCGYNSDIQREYGFTTFEGAIHIYYGIQPGNWSSRDKKNSDHVKVIYLPWREHHRDCIEFLNLNHTVFSTYRDKKNGAIDFDSLRQHEENVPKIVFAFNDYDGEEIEATCYLQTSHYCRGKGLFKFLRLFTKEEYRRMDIQFNKQVGYEKNSWKGGTIGHSIDIMPNETPLSAFIRYGTSDDSYKNYGVKNRGFTNIKIKETING